MKGAALLRLLDLFCGAGGAGAGYAAAGFEIVGVDRDPQPRYPFEFHQGDALDFLRARGHEFDAIHASPPCQRFSCAVLRANREKHPDYLDATRQALQELGKPYVIENVPGAPLQNPVMMCGSGVGLPVQRHRVFETNFPLLVPGCAHHAYPAIYPPSYNRVNLQRVLTVSGGFQRGVTLEEYRAGMGVDWDMSLHELSESIPPRYTELIGGFMREAVLSGNQARAPR